MAPAYFVCSSEEPGAQELDGKEPGRLPASAPPRAFVPANRALGRSDGNYGNADLQPRTFQSMWKDGTFFPEARSSSEEKDGAVIRLNVIWEPGPGGSVGGSI